MFTKDLRLSILVLISYSDFAVSIFNVKFLDCHCHSKVTHSTHSSSCGSKSGIFERLMLFQTT
jgi:hypothetical protein